MDNCPGPNSEQSGKAPQCEGCPYQKQCHAGLFKNDNTPELIKNKLSNVKNIILILSGKGGVGKSTIASQLSLGLSLDPKIEVGLLDIDICGPSIPRMLGLENEEVHNSSEGWTPIYKYDNLAIMSIGFLLNNKNQPVIWRGPRKNGLIKQFLTEVIWDKLDYLIIDTPPGTSDEHLTIVNYLKECNIKGAIIVTTPQEISLLDVRKEINFCQKTNINVLGVVENMAGFVCPHCSKKSEIFEANTGGAEGLCKEFNLKLIGRLPLEPNILQSCEKGTYFPDSFPKTDTSKEIENIIQFIIKI
jgi:Mrp family chromosome partitioning ATPase